MIPLSDDNPAETKPILTVTIIAVNVLVFAYQITLAPRASQLMIYQYGAIPAVVAGKQSLAPPIAVVPPMFSIITSMFLHGGFFHIIGNMLYLWIFGNNIEDAMGRIRYLAFYLICGVAASLSHILSDPSSVIPTIGASGAISGVLGAYLMLYPRAHVLVLIPLGLFTRLLNVPAGIVLGFWFLMQVLSGTLSSGEGGGVAWWAHIGGFVAGMVLVGAFKKRNVRFFNPPRHRTVRGYEW
jgi:membrane associated rhomboid family serine protease